MDKLIAFCGLECSACPAYIATQKNDDEERTKVAKMWSEEFKTEIKPEDINCNSCLSREEPLFNHCKICDIRLCGLEKKVQNCGFCDDYICEKLTKFFEMAPIAKENLEEERRQHRA